MGRERARRGDPGSGGEGAGRCAAGHVGAGAAGNRAGSHGGAAAAPGAGGGGLYGEESGEGEYPEDAGSGAEADLGFGGSEYGAGFLPLPAAASGSFRTTACQPADPGRGVPGVVAAPLEALLTLRTGASAERMKSVSPRHAQGRLPPAPKARPGRGCPLARVEKPPGVRCSASPTFQSCAAASQVSSQSPPKEHRQGERPETRRCSASSVAWSCSAHAAMSHMLFCFDPLNVMRLLIPLP